MLVVIGSWCLPGCLCWQLCERAAPTGPKDENVKWRGPQVDVQLQRRADLIPNLVETVKGFTKEESTVFGDIANARAGC